MEGGGFPLHQVSKKGSTLGWNNIKAWFISKDEISAKGVRVGYSPKD
jgi:hypothetical protein